MIKIIYLKVRNWKLKLNIGTILTVSAILLIISIVGSSVSLTSSANEVEYWLNRNQTNYTNSNCIDTTDSFLLGAKMSMVITNIAWILSSSFFVCICIESFYILHLGKRQGSTQPVVKSQPTPYLENQDEQERLLMRD